MLVISVYTVQDNCNVSASIKLHMLQFFTSLVINSRRLVDKEAIDILGSLYVDWKLYFIH